MWLNESENEPVKKIYDFLIQTFKLNLTPFVKYEHRKTTGGFKE